MKLGSKIVKLRQAKDLTQYELSNRADISISYLRKIESDNCSRPHLKTLAKLASALTVPLVELLEGR